MLPNGQDIATRVVGKRFVNIGLVQARSLAHRVVDGSFLRSPACLSTIVACGALEASANDRFEILGRKHRLWRLADHGLLSGAKCLRELEDID